MRVEIIREYSEEVQTLGIMTIYDNDEAIFVCKTLELPWKDNQHNISCIPVETYTVVKRSSPNHPKAFHITNVPNRGWILIHKGNFFTDIRGCILVGTNFKDINHDGYKDVVNSSVTMKKLNQLLPDSFEITIKNA